MTYISSLVKNRQKYYDQKCKQKDRLTVRYVMHSMFRLVNIKSDYVFAPVFVTGRVCYALLKYLKLQLTQQH